MPVVRKDAFAFLFSPARDAEAIVRRDPAISAGLFAGTVSPFRIVMLA